MIKDTGLIQSKDFSVGLFTNSNIINANPNLSPNCMDIKWYFDNCIGKRFGSSTTNSVVIGSASAASWIIDSMGNLSTTLRSYWKMDEPSGIRFDAINRYNLADNNSVESITGIRGQAGVYVAANSESLLVGNTADLQSAANFTIAGWIYRNSTSPTLTQTIVSKRFSDIERYVKLYLPCGGVNGATAFPDNSSFKNSVTANGNAQVDTSITKFGGGSLKCDGTGDYLTVPDSADWQLDDGVATNPWTVEFFVYFNSLPGRVGLIAQYENSGSNWAIYSGNGETLAFIINDTLRAETPGSSFVINTWYHVAVVNDSGVIRLFINGNLIRSDTNATAIPAIASTLDIGNSNAFVTNALNGYLENIVITKGFAKYKTTFIPPGALYENLNSYEYWLYVNTNNRLTFRVSSSGLVEDSTVQADSAGDLSVNTWYRVIAWHSNGQHIGVDVNLSVNTALYTSGVKIGSSGFVVGGVSNGLTGYMDGRIDEVGFWQRGLTAVNRNDLYGGGTGNTYTPGQSAFSWASFDFGASGARWLTIAAGTGIVASSNLGTTFVTVATSRTQNYQYLDRSKNVLIATSDSYDPTLYWAGSAGTFASVVAINSAPSAKFSVNYQGFLVLLNYANSNGVISNRGFAYADENTQLTSTWADSFNLPSSDDDEITGPFILNKFLYVSTKYRIFRLDYAGGNPDWKYIEVAKFGFVPRTIRVFAMKGQQVAVGLDWSKRLRVFYGYESDILSDNVENDNDYCEFGTEKISLQGSGLVISNAEFDQNEQEYRINVAIGLGTTQTTHALVLNARTLAMYPYSNQPYNTMCVATSAGRQFLMAVDRSGFVHILNSGNTDVSTPINEVYDSPLLFNKTPSEVTKNRQINFFFSHESCGTIYYQQAFDFSRNFSEMKPLRNQLGQAELLGSESVLQLVRTVDLPSVQNVFQYRITSSAGTADPWKLTHFDLFNSGLGYGRGA